MHSTITPRAVQRFVGFSQETAARDVQANLPAQQELTCELAQALHNMLGLSRQDRLGWRVAIDTHNVC